MIPSYDFSSVDANTKYEMFTKDSLKKFFYVFIENASESDYGFYTFNTITSEYVRIPRFSIYPRDHYAYFRYWIEELECFFSWVIFSQKHYNKSDEEIDVYFQRILDYYAAGFGSILHNNMANVIWEYDYDLNDVHKILNDNKTYYPINVIRALGEKQSMHVIHSLMSNDYSKNFFNSETGRIEPDDLEELLMISNPTVLQSLHKMNGRVRKLSYKDYRGLIEIGFTSHSQVFNFARIYGIKPGSKNFVDKILHVVHHEMT